MVPKVVEVSSLYLVAQRSRASVSVPVVAACLTYVMSDVYRT